MPVTRIILPAITTRSRKWSSSRRYAFSSGEARFAASPFVSERGGALRKPPSTSELLWPVWQQDVFRQCYAGGAMGITGILRKIFLVDLIQGLGVTFRYQ